MSEFTLKNHIGLMEAYASIYQQPELVVNQNVEEEICFENLKVDSEIVVNLVVDRLIVEGYANTEDQALNMIPHMSDAWLNNVVGNFVLEESFIDAVNSLVEEGYDLSSYTVDELFEDYIRHFNNYLTEDHYMDLHEVVPLLAAPLVANPATLAAGAALGAGALYAGKKAYDAYRQRRTGWNQSAMDNVQWRDSKPTVKPVTTLKARTGNVNLDPPSANPKTGNTNLDTPSVYPGTGYDRGNVNLKSLERKMQDAKQRVSGGSSGGGPSGGGGGGGKPPEKPPSGGGGGKPPEKPPSGGGGKPEWVKNFTDSLLKKGQENSPGPLRPLMQRVQQRVQNKAPEIAATAGTSARRIAKGALGLGVGGVVDQGLLGGIGGKVTRDVTNFSRGLGSGYEKLKREIQGKPEPTTPTPAPEDRRKSAWNNLK